MYSLKNTIQQLSSEYVNKANELEKLNELYKNVINDNNIKQQDITHIKLIVFIINNSIISWQKIILKDKNNMKNFN